MRLFALLIVSATALLAQVGNGTITGTVTDPAGAVVAGASVEARNTATGVVHPTVSTNTGNYTIADLPVGTYVVTVRVTGFKTYSHSNLAVAATQILRENVALEVGTAAESVTVTAEASLLKTESGELAHNVTIETLDSLPLIGIGTTNAGTSGYRNPYNSILTLPGVSGYNPSGTFTINGLGGGGFSPALTEAMRIEGQDATSRNYGNYNYTQMAQPSVDAIQEIAYQTSNYAPEYGQAGSVAINITMKSGTNQYHGTGYDYFVNEDLDAGNAFSQSGGCLVGPTGRACSATGGNGSKFRPRSRRNDFGGTLGGPIYIPKVYDGHNRTFFFFNYEEFLETNLYSYNDTVPTLNYLAGNFSEISPNGTCSACGQLGVQMTALGSPRVEVDPNGNHIFANEIFDPSTRAVATAGSLAGQGYALPFPGNMIPANRFDPVSLKILSFVPKPNNTNFLGNYAVNQPGNRYSSIPSFKIDHNIDANNKLSFYYSENTTANQFNNTLGGADGLPDTITAARGSFITNYQERLNYDRTIKPTLLLHLGVGYFHQSFVDDSPELTFTPKQTLGLSGFLANRNFPLIQGNCAGVFGCTAVTGGMQNLGPGAGQNPTFEEKPTMGASLTWVRGKHTYKVGADLYLEGNIGQSHPLVTMNSGTAGTSDPYVNVNGFGGFSPGFGFASFLLGDYSRVSQGIADDHHYGTQTWDVYIQDSWKVTRKLTLDYGLRWDYDTPYREQYGRLGQLDAAAPNLNAGGRLGATRYASTCNCEFYKGAYPYAIGPRLGVAYQLDPKTVFRGGWGVNYQFVQNAAGGSVSSPGVYPLAANSPAYVPSSNQFVNIQTPGAIRSPMWPVTDPNQFPVLGTTGGQPTGFVPDQQELRPPRITQWSIGFQREITRSFVMEASYVGNHAVWLNGSLGFLSQLSTPYLATFGLFPTPGTGPVGHDNEGDRALLADPISSTAVTQFLASRGIKSILPYSGFPTSATLQSALYPFPQFGNLGVSGSPTGDSKYDALQIKVTKRFSHHFQAEGSYTWGQGFTRASRQDFFNPASSVWALQSIPPQTLTFNATYNVPSASFLPKFLNAIAKDWQLGWYSTYKSGTFLVPPTSNVNTNYLSSLDVRVPGQPLYTPGVNINDPSTYDPYFTQVLNPKAWTPCPSNATCMATGNLYKDFRAPRTPSENANIGRHFRVGKEGRYDFYLRGEFVNIFNRTIMPAPSVTNPQNAPGKNSLGIYTSGYGIINAYAAPNVTAGGGAPFLTGRQGTIIARFSF